MSGRVNNLNMMNKIQNIKARIHGLTAAIILGLGAGSSIQALDFNEGEHVVFTAQYFGFSLTTMNGGIADFPAPCEHACTSPDYIWPY